MAFSSSDGAVLTKDRDWAVLDGLLCEVISFIPLAKLEGAKIIPPGRSMPYAVVEIACYENGMSLPKGTLGAISHQADFLKLWAAYVDRGVGKDERLFIHWSKRNLRPFARLFSVFMPRIAVLIFKNDGYELVSDNKYRPELCGVDRWLASKPIVHWQPSVW